MSTPFIQSNFPITLSGLRQHWSTSKALANEETLLRKKEKLKLQYFETLNFILNLSVLSMFLCLGMHTVLLWIDNLLLICFDNKCFVHAQASQRYIERFFRHKCFHD